MRIAVDLRSLQSGTISGVENYTANLLEHLLAKDRTNEYVLFYNSWGDGSKPNLHFINADIRQTHVPNKILNAQLLLGWTNLEKLIGRFDALFMPNLNQYNILPGKKLVLTVHDLSPVVTPEFYDMKRRVWHKFLNYRKAFERASLIFAVSEYTKLDLVRLFNVPESKIKVAYPGIDTATFQPNIPEAKLREVRNNYSLPGEYILFLSTVEPRKNLSNLIRAFDTLPEPVHLVIVGRQGWKYNSIFKLLEQSKKRNKIHYLGYLDEQDKAAVIKLSQTVVYPSFYEGFGFVPVEAAACGVPSVISQVTSLPEVMGDASLLVDPYNVQSIAAAISAVLSNQNLRANLVSKGISRSKEFTWEKTAEEILEGLNKIDQN